MSDIVQFTKKIQRIEINNNFFEEKDSEGMLYWDIVRHDVFYLIYYHVANIQTIPSKINYVSRFKNVLSNIFGVLNFKFRVNRKYKYICFIASRNKNEKRENVDHISNDILEQIHKDSLVIESFNRNKKNNKFNSIFNFGIIFENSKISLAQILKKESIDLEFRISKILKNEFSIDINLNKSISEIIKKYKISKYYYLKLFKRTKPKAIFIVQNGIQKGLFEAANILGVPVIELQHGFIGFVHPAYSYPKNLKIKNLSTFPSHFFTFSSFWTENLHFPVKNIVPFGNSYFAMKKVKDRKEYDLTFIFANIYTKDLMKVIDDLLRFGYKGQICIKLHPNQISELKIIEETYKVFSNVSVLSNNISMSDVLSLSKSIVAVQSTSVYEALHNGVKVFIIKVKDYMTHEDILDDLNVYLIDNNQSIIKLTKNNFITTEKNSIFQEFKQNKFTAFLNNLK
jgi:hypothetical protein